MPQGGATPGSDDVLDLRGYVAVLRRRWRAIVLIAAAAATLAFVLSFQQAERYRAESDVLIEQPSGESIFGAEERPQQDSARTLNNAVRQVEAGYVVEAVEAAYDGPLDPEDVRAAVVSEETDVIRVHTTAGDPDEAAALVNTYVDTFLDVIRQQRVDDLTAAAEEVQARLDDIAQEITEVRAPLEAAELALAADPDDEGLIAQRNLAASRIASRLAGLDGRQAFYLGQLQDLQLSAGFAQGSGAEVLNRADVPTVPISPRPARDAAIALLLGLVLGVGVAFLVDNLDERIRSISDLERATDGMPTLALVPEAQTSGGPTFVAARDDPRSPTAEAYRSLRTAVKFAAIDREIKVILVTSGAAGEGKTTTAANLAIALSQGGDRVAVVCCDLRRPTMHERFDLPQVPGFTDVLVGDVSLSAALRRYEGSIMVLPAGSHAPNPSELLSTTRAAGVIAALSEEFDFVVLDSTPVLPVTDAMVVSRLVDATVLVVDARSTRRNAIRRTLQLLAQVSAPVLGIALNGVPQGDDYGLSYGYGGYGAADDDADPARNGRRQAGEQQPTSTST